MSAGDAILVKVEFLLFWPFDHDLHDRAGISCETKSLQINVIDVIHVIHVI